MKLNSAWNDLIDLNREAWIKNKPFIVYNGTTFKAVAPETLAAELFAIEANLRGCIMEIVKDLSLDQR